MYTVVNHRHESHFACFDDAAEAFEFARRHGLVVTTGGNPIGWPIVTQILGRVHCGEPLKNAVRAVADAIKGGVKGWRKIDRKTRRQLLAHIVLTHRANAQLYRDVVFGNV